MAEMNDPDGKGGPQPKKPSRVPDWVITDWEEPWAKARVPPKWSLAEAWEVVKIGLLSGLVAGLAMLYLVAHGSPSRTVYGISAGTFLFFFFLILRVLRYER